MSRITKEGVGEHSARLSELKRKIPHQISEVGGEIQGNLLGVDFNCFEHAFDLICSEEYKACREFPQPWKIRQVGGSSDFARFLIENAVLKETTRSSSEHGLIVYFDSESPTHAGKLARGRVTSKWGQGLLLQHNIDEVPAVYGNEARTFQKLDFETCIDSFIAFAKANGIRFEE